MVTLGEKIDDLVLSGLHYKMFANAPKGAFRNGKKEGPWVSHHYNGQLFWKGTFKEGKEEGPWVSYWDNGQLLEKGIWKDGKKEGSWVLYFGNGTLLAKGIWKDGKRENGYWVRYQYDGQSWTKGTSKDSKLESPWFYFYDYDSGKLKRKRTYKDGKEHGEDVLPSEKHHDVWCEGLAGSRLMLLQESRLMGSLTANRLNCHGIIWSVA